MSADQKKPETSAAGEKLSRYWAQFKQGQLISYRAMAVILLVVAGVGLWLYIRSEKVVGASKTWLELDGASTEESLKKFAEDHPDTPAAKVARLHLARHLLGPEGIEQLSSSRDPASHKQAVDSIQKAKEIFQQLAEQSADDPVIQAESYLGLAKAEVALIGVIKEDTTDDFVGSAEKATEWLDKLAEVAEGTPWGEDAKKASATLKDLSKRGELTSVQQMVYKLGTQPSLPAGGGPLPPFGSPFGGSPFGTPPFSAIPGGPVEPPVPEATKGTPKTEPPGVGSAPIPAAVAPLVPGKQPSTPVPPPPPPPTPPKK
jgi:hypothetical protein